MNDLLARAKADPESFRRETVEALRDAGWILRALEIDDRNMRSLSKAWPGGEPADPETAGRDARAKAHNDALLQALTEMTPAERTKLGW